MEEEKKMATPIVSMGERVTSSFLIHWRFRDDLHGSIVEGSCILTTSFHAYPASQHDEVCESVKLGLGLSGGNLQILSFCKFD